jgi:hypothetical protein
MYGQGRDPRLSAFLPPTRTVEPTFLADRLAPAAWVAGVHEARGLVAYHPGSAEVGSLVSGLVGSRRSNQPTSPPAHQPTSPPPAKSSDQRSKALSLATALLQTRAYGADLLAFEGGVPGELELPTQLAVWDVLLANGLVMGGVGVSRPTGVVIPSDGEATLGKQREQGLRSRGAGKPVFISWLWARDKTAPGLLASLRDRRVFFGELGRWKGSCDLRLTDRLGRKEYGRMGQEVKGIRENVFLHLDLDPPRGAEVWVIQGLLRPGRSVHYVRREVVVDPTRAVLLDTRQACFVRVEVWDDTGPMVCSNPLIIHKPE